MKSGVPESVATIDRMSDEIHRLLAENERLRAAIRRELSPCDCGRNPMYPESQVPHRYECAFLKLPRLRAALEGATDGR